jgi:hypothetical protein
MLRATSLTLLLSGSVLLVTWAALPAESQQPRARTLPPVAAEIPADLAAVNAEVDRLVGRLERHVDFPPPARDLFHYASRRPAAPEVIAPAGPRPAIAAELLRPSWPSLVAIMGPGVDGTFEVALSDRTGELHVVTSGGSVGAFVVSEITVDAVVLSDPASGETTRLTVR